MSMKLCVLALLGCSLSVFSQPAAQADEYPNQPIHMIVGVSPGGGTDFIARLSAQRLSEKLGVSVIVENKPGAAGRLAADYVSHAKPDGYTLLTVASDFVIPQAGYTPTYDPVTSFEPVTEFGYIPLLLTVNTQTPTKSVAELISYAKANPGKLSYGGQGPGSIANYAFGVLGQKTGTEFMDVQFPGGESQQVAQLGNEVQLNFSPISTSVELVKSGRLVGLGITGTARSDLLPNVPTINEAVGASDLDGAYNWHGLLAPAGTPKEVVQKLNDILVEFIHTEDFKKVMDPRGYVGVGSTPAEFHDFLVSNVKRFTAAAAQQ